MDELLPPPTSEEKALESKPQVPPVAPPPATPPVPSPRPTPPLYTLPPREFSTPTPPPFTQPAPTPHEPTFTPMIKPPSAKQQSWGAVISMVIIVLMIVIGAFYTWGKRINEERAAIEQLTATTTAQ